MTYGIAFSGANGLLSVNSDWASLTFIGKAIWTGVDSVFAADLPSLYWDRNFGPFGASYTSGASGGVGLRTFIARSESSFCGSLVGTLTTPNDNGVFKYSIASPDYPHIFVSTTNPAVCPTVMGIRDTGTVNDDGWPIWHVFVSLSYPAGMRAGAVPYVDVYCFSQMFTTPVDEYGIKVFDSAGNITFNSGLNPLRIKNVITITGTTMSNPADLSTLDIEESILGGDLPLLTDLAKPAFMSTDIARYVVTKRINMGLLTRYAIIGNGNAGCEPLAYPSIDFTQTFLMNGVRLAADGTLLYSIVGMDARNCGVGTSSSSTSIAKIESFPVRIPVIDGAEYD